MATIVNTPSTRADDAGTGVVVGILFVVLVLILLAVFGLPYLRNRSAPLPADSGTNINVTLPGTSGGAAGGASGSVGGSAGGAAQ